MTVLKIRMENLKTSPGDVMYSMRTIRNNTILYIWKLLREYFLKVLLTRRKKVTMCGIDVNQTYCGGHFTVYTRIESLRCMPKTSTML